MNEEIPPPGPRSGPPDDAVHEPRLPEGTVASETADATVAAEETDAPEAAVPDATAEAVAPEAAATKADTPATVEPDAARPEASATDVNAAEAASLEAAALASVTLEADVPATAGPEADVPEAAASEADAPEADIPDADASEAGETKPVATEAVAPEPTEPEAAPPEPVVAGPKPPDEASIRLAEALVFSSAEPVSPRGLQRLLPDDMDAEAVLAALRERYAGRGVELVDAADGVMFRTAPDLAPQLRKVIDAPRRLPRVAMETLAIVAYHQPMTRPEIEHIRGAALSQQTLDALLELNLIAPKGRRETPGRPTLWGTTPEFLAHFGLKDIRELPRREDLLLEPMPPRPETVTPDLQSPAEKPPPAENAAPSPPVEATAPTVEAASLPSADAAAPPPPAEDAMSEPPDEEPPPS